MVVLVESEPLQSKPIKSGTAQQFVEVFSLHFRGHLFKDKEAEQEAPGRTLEVDFELGSQHLARKFS